MQVLSLICNIVPIIGATVVAKFVLARCSGTMTIRRSRARGLSALLRGHHVFLNGPWDDRLAVMMEHYCREKADDPYNTSGCFFAIVPKMARGALAEILGWNASIEKISEG